MFRIFIVVVAVVAAFAAAAIAYGIVEEDRARAMLRGMSDEQLFEELRDCGVRKADLKKRMADNRATDVERATFKRCSETLRAARIALGVKQIPQDSQLPTFDEIRQQRELP